MADEIRYVEEKLPSANLSGLINAVNQMQQEVGRLEYDVAEVDTKVNTVKATFEAFLHEFRAYVAQDLMDRRYQEALQDQVTLQQELDDKFGQHQKVRRYVVGILQASDARLVRKETVEVATNELMIAIPHYWLVPALVALAAWVNDNQELAQKALREAMVRDDEKTSLLFALICRRASRSQAAMTWLQRYFAMQDPMNMERKMIVVLDAYANGLFGGDSRNLCAEQIGGWIAEMEDVAGFREAQVARWEKAIAGKIPGSVPTSYPYLEKYASNWPLIRQTLQNASLHQVLQAYVQGILEKPQDDTGELRQQLDQLLDSLVTNFDSEELPLRRQKRIADLVIECKGDEAEAMRKYAAEQTSFDEHMDLMQLLTNAAMSPELVHASAATQKLSLAVSRDWLIQAYDNVTLANRAAAVGNIEFKIEGFEGETFEGENEEELKTKARAYFGKLRDDELEKVKQSPMDYFLMGGGLLIMILGFFTSIPWFIGVAAGVFGVLKFWLGRKNVEKTIAQVKEKYAKIMHDACDIIAAICAEAVDLRREIDRLESGYEKTQDYLARIAPHQFIGGSQRRMHTA